MGTNNRDRGGIGGDPDLFTVLEFAEKYRVDAAVVRGWIKRGYIPYVLEGTRKMRRIKVSAVDLVRPIIPSQLEAEILYNREQLISHFIVYSGMEEGVAREVAGSMDDEAVKGAMLEFVGASLTGAANG